MNQSAAQSTPVPQQSQKNIINQAKAVVDGFPWVTDKNSPKIKSAWVEINPSFASVILSSLNDNNRPLSDSTVDAYATDMENGTWGKSNDAICFSKTYRLLNGQNRLKAVVKSGKTILFFVQFGFDNSDFMHMDSGKKRNGANRLQIGGICTKGASKVSSMATCLFEYMVDALGTGRESPTNDQHTKIAKRWVKEFQEAVLWQKNNLNKPFHMNDASSAFAIFCILNGKLKHKGKDFIGLLSNYIHRDPSTAYLASPHPIPVLVDELTASMRVRKVDQHKTRISKGAMIMEAFDNFCNGVNRKSLKSETWTSRAIIGDFDQE
jgi:hypothetical protein